MIRRTAAAVLALAVINIATIAPANAHEGLVSSTPASDSALTQSPTEVSLTFTSEPLDVGSSITVVASSGETWGGRRTRPGRCHPDATASSAATVRNLRSSLAGRVR